MTTRRDFIRQFLVGGAAALVAPRILTDRVLPSALASELASAQADGPWEMIYGGILARIKAPVFPRREFLITKFGAQAGGLQDCSQALTQAIAACHKAGGGNVVVPEGIFLTGPVHLLSNVNLHLSRGATLKFSQNPKDYLPTVFTRWEGTDLMNYSPFIYALNQTNFFIREEGTREGQSDTEHGGPGLGGE